MTRAHIHRRQVLQWTLCALSVGAGLVSAEQATSVQGGHAHGRRKMIIRADDVGFTEVCNLGAFEAIQKGVVTAADVMLDCPGTEDALRRLKEFPWISVGWHMHMWGTPVSAPASVPTLIEQEGPFQGRFRTDVRTAKDVSEAEAVLELRAQLARCHRVLGRFPDTAGSNDPSTPWDRAVRLVLDEHKIPYNFMAKAPADEATAQKIARAQSAGEEWAQSYPKGPGSWRDADPRWKDRNIVSLAPTTAYTDLLTDSVTSVEQNYDPVRYYTEDRAGIFKYPQEVIVEQSWHPGWVDYFVYRTGERANRARARQFVIGRAQDVAALCDERLKNWIRENGIELVNGRDALYGTDEYQKHLRDIGSNLAVPV